MANKDIFKQAIAEAKSVREAAIANAKEALEESLTPHLKDMLAAKLQEMDEKEVDEEVTLAEEEVDEMKDKKDESIDEMDHDDKKDESFDVAEADEDEAEDDAEDAADDALDGMDDEAGEEPAGDEELGDLSVDDFKSLVRDIIAQEMGDGGEELGADDMDAGDLDAELPADDMGGEEGGEEEIDLDELLRELEATNEGDKKDDDTMEEKKDHDKDDTMEEGEDKDDDKMEEVSTAQSTEVQDSANPEAQGTNVNRTVKEVAELEVKLDAAINEAKDANDQLQTATETVETLRAELNEVNILNAKLLYVNKIFKNNDLNESQKVNVIAAFDKAETVKEVKLVYETVADNFITKEKEVKKVSTKKTAIKESKGLASKATGTTAKKPEAPVLNEVSDAVRRMQELAGIIN